MPKYLHCLPASAALLLMTSLHSAVAATMYGTVTAGLSYVDHIGAKNGSVVRASNSEWGTSLIGIQMAEALTSDVQLLIRLESGFNTATGTVGSDGMLFSRYSTLGVESKTWGRLEAGRSMAYSNDVWYIDPMGLNWSGSATLTKGHSWNAWSHTVGYRSPQSGGMAIGLQSSVGGRACRSTAAALSFQRGGLDVRAIYDETRDSQGQLSELFDASREWIVGARYDQSANSWFVAYNIVRAPDASASGDTSMRHVWAGVNHKIGSRDLLRLGIYGARSNVTDSRALLVSGGWEHTFAPALTLWGTAAVVRNNREAAFPVAAYWQDLPAPGATQHTVNGGLIYTF
ncbi:porin [Duganella sp. FT3S]|uniref:Porin n=1 Tax=Rugamonas fusca TaxID=2758568 RepID=A0A7W2EL05_9BURK|nr:porin [Rugamonas fusca]MBA5607752.1 porin [Rugamonas fusca]